MKQNYLSLVVGFLLLPTFLQSQNLSLSGFVTRHNQQPVSDIEVACFDTVFTNFDGFYEMLEIPMNTSCQFMLNGTFDKFEDITVLDAVRLRQHILQVSDLDLFQLSAADVNSSQTITTLDLVKILDLAVLKDDGGTTNYKFLNSANPLTNSFGITVTDTLENINFTAVKRGDITISADHIPAPPEAPSPIFSITENEFQVGETVKIEVNVEDFDNIQGFQTTFSWDPNLLGFESISDFQNLQIPINEAFLDEGKLPVVVTGFGGSSSGETLVRLNFNALADAPNIDTHVKMTGELIPQQVVWANPVDNKLFLVEGEYIGIFMEPVSVKTLPQGIRNINVFPNPVEEFLNVNVLLNKKIEVELSIVNVLGQIVFSENYEQEQITTNVDVSGLVAGTYFLKLKTESGSATKIFMKK